jgi:hypothetical protein
MKKWLKSFGRIIIGKSPEFEVVQVQWLRGQLYKLRHTFATDGFCWYKDCGTPISITYYTKDMALVHFGEWTDRNWEFIEQAFTDGAKAFQEAVIS